MSRQRQHDVDGRKTSTKMFVIGALLVSLLLAGIVSFYASGSPDGLNKVAADHGLADQGEGERDGGLAAGRLLHQGRRPTSGSAADWPASSVSAWCS